MVSNRWSFQLCFVTGLFLFVCSINTRDALAQRVLTPEVALEIALANSPRIRDSQLNLEKNQERLNATRARLKSQFSLSLTPLSYRQTRQFNDLFSTWYTNETKQSSGTFQIEQPIKWTDGTLRLINYFTWRDDYSSFQDLSSRTYTNNLYLSFEQPIFTYNRTKLELRELELDYENASLNYAIQRLELEMEVMTRFFELYQKKMSLEIAVEELENNEQNYQTMKNKVEAGLAAKDELYQEELNYENSKAKVQNEQVALEDAMDSFKRLLGLSIFEEISVEADISHQPVDIDLKQAIDHGLKNRMELRERHIGIEQAQYNLTRTSAQNEFKGSIEVSYGSIGTDERFENIYDSPEKSQEFSLSLNIPLWDWGEKRSRIKVAEADIKAAKFDLEDEKVQIMIDIRSTYRDLQKNVRQIEIARKGVRLAQMTYEIDLERYRSGELSSFELSQKQAQLSERKMSLVDAQIGYKLALLDMKIKSLWDFEKNQPVLPFVSDN